jgi:hypothetical protein
MSRKNESLRMTLAAGLAVMLATAFTSVVGAAILSVSGEITKIAPPPSVELSQLESNTTMFAFDERQCVTLLAPLKVNISVPGTYDESDDLAPSVIPAGTRVSSQFVQADRETSIAKIELEGTLTTDAPILGLITANGSLSNSDFLGAIGTVYPTGSAGRAMQFNGGDWVVLDAGLHSVTIHVANSQHADQVRVITECALPPPPPPPGGGGAEGCTPGYWKQDHHFDSWQVYAPTDSFNAVFGITGPFADSLTLLGALQQGGGGINALGRHAVAALLGSVHSGVDYGLTEAEVIEKTKAAYESGIATQIEGTKNVFAALNEKGCPLN